MSGVDFQALKTPLSLFFFFFFLGLNHISPSFNLIICLVDKSENPMVSLEAQAAVAYASGVTISRRCLGCCCESLSDAACMFSVVVLKTPMRGGGGGMRKGSGGGVCLNHCVDSAAACQCRLELVTQCFCTSCVLWCSGISGSD